eukprot:jgi/Undpi1/8579/HiC_scaffold_25.g11044.m1
MTIDDVGLFAALYPDLPEEDGLKASRNERLSNGYRSITLTYGEVSASGRWKGGLKDAVTVGGSKGATAEIEFVKGDFTVLDWSDGDVVFANSTCFDDDLMKKTAKAVASLKEGAIVITTTDTVPSPALEVLEEDTVTDGGNLFVGGADSGLKLSGTASGKGLESPDQRRLLLFVLIPATESLNKREGRTVMVQAGRSATTCFIQRRLPKAPPAFDPA